MALCVNATRRILARAGFPRHGGAFVCAASLSASPVGAPYWEPVIHVFQIESSGAVSRTHKTLEDFKRLKRETRLPIRDMRIFFSPLPQGGDAAQGGNRHLAGQDSLPVILSRPSSNCFLLHLDSIKLLCLRESCMVLHPEDGAVAAFVEEMKKQLRDNNNQSGAADEDEDLEEDQDGRLHVGFSTGGAHHTADSQMHVFLEALGDRSGQKFEAAVLEAAVSTVSRKYRRQLNLLRPMMDVMLHETTSSPSADALRRMLAFRKSLGAFETNVVSVRGALRGLLAEEQDLAGLCLSVPPSTLACAEMMEELELILEAYNADLKEVELELAAMKEQIEDTNDFIKMHLDTTRNRIIKLSLFMEMGTLSVGAGALLAGVFGMNLLHTMESHPYAFFAVTGGIFTVVGSLFGAFARRFFALSKDYSSAKSYQTLKNFFQYVENVESALQASEGKGLDRKEFRELLEPLIDVQLTEEEVNAIFKLLDENRDGTLDVEDLSRALYYHNKRPDIS